MPMRPPDHHRRKGPPRRQTRQGHIQKKIARKQPKRGKNRNQHIAYLPRTSSLQAAAKAAVADPWLPIRARTFAFGVSHRLSVGGRIDPDDANLIRHIDAARRRTLAALVRAYGGRP